ncbi:GntR family transcriptional regulator [Bacillus sp. FJAT-49736]|uniref:GntR family transcriptional regulator n=1 Tax=Bacillus sp. FJAT-49736 TaxID=2833582 RepID=UPI001BC9551B|nr:GntR family transcriptional regulator [Bacillus sp. FJAT-49736]MBS4174207.1 GntR family transcriptional regulator [Bacillus sp. FJAT-49736]
MINKKSRVPLYAQLIDIIVEKIRSGEWKEFDKLPSERELCDMYDISRTTIRQAMIELENEGYIYKEHGKGSFVSPQAFTQNLVTFYSFTEEMKKLGKKPSTKILSFKIIPAPKKIALKLGLAEDEDVFEFARLRLADDEPIIYETTYLPYYQFPKLTELELSLNSMYELFQKKYDIRITNANERFKAVGVGLKEAPFLTEKVGAPALNIERLAFFNGRAVEYTLSVARGDKFVYETELK